MKIQNFAKTIYMLIKKNKNVEKNDFSPNLVPPGAGGAWGRPKGPKTVVFTLVSDS